MTKKYLRWLTACAIVLGGLAWSQHASADIKEFNEGGILFNWNILVGFDEYRRLANTMIEANEAGNEELANALLENHVIKYIQCFPSPGDDVVVAGEPDHNEMVKVAVVSGGCSGQTGWVGTWTLRPAR